MVLGQRVGRGEEEVAAQGEADALERRVAPIGVWRHSHHLRHGGAPHISGALPDEREAGWQLF